MTHGLNIPPSKDAALVVALAGTAMPFSQSAEDEAERWLRTLRLHGQVGATLQALGVGEAPLATGPEAGALPAPSPPLGERAVDDVDSRASLLAAARGAAIVGTGDLLVAVMDVYGGFFNRALLRRGTSRGELLDRLADEQPALAPVAVQGPAVGSAAVPRARVN